MGMSGNAPVHYAARERKTEVVQLLLLRRAHIDTLDNAGCSLRRYILASAYLLHVALMTAGADVRL